jgi:hypothetical protein
VSLFLSRQVGSSRELPCRARASEGTAGTFARCASEGSAVTSTGQGPTVIERAWVAVCGAGVVESVTSTVNE